MRVMLRTRFPMYFLMVFTFAGDDTKEAVNEEVQKLSNSDEDDMYTFKNFSL